jgi:DNA invertase Pin-like site-specific DNA recombinase
VVVAKLDRLSRSVVDAGRLLDEARKRGFNIVALDLGLDLSTPTSELVANVLAAVAQWERSAG